MTTDLILCPVRAERNYHRYNIYEQRTKSSGLCVPCSFLDGHQNLVRRGNVFLMSSTQPSGIIVYLYLLRRSWYKFGPLRAMYWLLSWQVRRSFHILVPCKRQFWNKGFPTIITLFLDLGSVFVILLFSIFRVFWYLFWLAASAGSPWSRNRSWRPSWPLRDSNPRFQGSTIERRSIREDTTRRRIQTRLPVWF